MKDERKRKSRLYHEEENVPDLAELSVLDDMKRQYSLTCVVMAGLLTWLPVVVCSGRLIFSCNGDSSYLHSIHCYCVDKLWS